MTNKKEAVKYDNLFTTEELFEMYFDVKCSIDEDELDKEIKSFTSVLQLFKKYVELRDDECKELRDALNNPRTGHHSRLLADVDDSTALYLEKKLTQLIEKKEREWKNESSKLKVYCDSKEEWNKLLTVKLKYDLFNGVVRKEE
jgi:hypothetical protein